MGDYKITAGEERHVMSQDLGGRRGHLWESMGKVYAARKGKKKEMERRVEYFLHANGKLIQNFHRRKLL